MNWRLGVVGSPIAHSLSPQLHEAGLRLAGLSGSSQRVELSLADASLLAGMLESEFDALSVTSPLKNAAAQLCDELTEAASRTQSVNSLLRRGGVVMGASTDGDGFVDALNATFGEAVENAHAVVLGAGGAASSILDALIERGASSVVVHGRNEQRVEDLAGRYPNAFSASLVYRPVDLIVNTIPVAGRDAEAAVLQGVHPETIAVDITYDPAESEWRTRYGAAGCRTMNGLPMLAYQAARQMRWWWDVDLSGADLLKVLT
jgi:shikimate dehydrogenase